MATDTDSIHVNDIGVSFTIIVVDDNGDVLDISNADELVIFLKKPDGTVLEKEASFVDDGTNGQFEYITNTGDLDMAGTWRIQGKIGLAASISQFYTDIEKFKVKANLEE